MQSKFLTAILSIGLAIAKAAAQSSTVYNNPVLAGGYPDPSIIRAGKDYWAPEISEYRGLYYVYYMGRKKDGPLSVAVATGGNRFGFAVSPDGRNWKTAGKTAEGGYLPPWDRGVRVALTVGGAQGASARFDWFRMAPVSPHPDATR